MDKKEINRCIKFIEKLIERPCAKPFISPIDDKEEGCELYYKRIKSPIFISTIQEKLLTNEYSSLEDVKHDISMIIKNTERFFGKNNFQSAMAHEMEKQFNNLIEKKEVNNTKTWMSKSSELLDKIETLIQNSPPVVKSRCKTISAVPPFPQMRADEIDNLIKMTEQLTEKKDVHKMLQIVLDLQPEIPITSTEMEIDIGRLEKSTLWILQDYVERRIRENNSD